MAGLQCESMIEDFEDEMMGLFKLENLQSVEAELCGEVASQFSSIYFFVSIRLFSGSFSLEPKGRPGMCDVLSLSGILGLSFDSPLLSPLCFFC